MEFTHGLGDPWSSHIRYGFAGDDAPFVMCVYMNLFKEPSFYCLCEKKQLCYLFYLNALRVCMVLSGLDS